MRALPAADGAVPRRHDGGRDADRPARAAGDHRCRPAGGGARRAVVSQRHRRARRGRAARSARPRPRWTSGSARRCRRAAAAGAPAGSAPPARRRLRRCRCRRAAGAPHLARRRSADRAAAVAAADAVRKGLAFPARRPTRWAGGGLGRPSGVVYAVSSDGILHVLGLPSGKDIQRPAEFLPANARWSDTIAVNTTLYATTTGNCGGAPNAVWAIDLESEAKPVVSWKSNGGPIVGRLAFATDGTVFAAIGPGTATGDGKVNAIVVARSQDASGERLVHAAGRRIRDRPDRVQAQRSGHRRRGDQGRPRASPGRGVPGRRGSLDAAARLDCARAAQAVAIGLPATRWRPGRN